MQDDEDKTKVSVVEKSIFELYFFTNILIILGFVGLIIMG